MNLGKFKKKIKFLNLVNIFVCLLSFSLVPLKIIFAENLPDYRIQAGTIFEDFENIGGWTITGTGASGVIDADHFKSGSGSLKLTSVNNVSAYARKNVNWDLSTATRFGIWFYIDDKTKYSNVTTGLVYLYTGASDAFVYSIYKGGATNEELQNGWNYRLMGKSDFTTSGSPNWSSPVTQIRIRSLSTLGNTVSLSVDNFVVDPFSRPKCIFSFDDGRSSLYTEGLPYLASKGFGGVAFVPMGHVGNPGYMTLPQLTEAYDAGWDIGGHSYSHVNLTTLSVLDATTEMQNEINALNAAGFTRAAYHQAWPFSAFNDSLIAAAGSVGMLSSRTGNNNIQPNNSNDPNRLVRYEIKTSLTLTDYQAIIDKAINLGGTVYLNLHDIVSPAVDETDITPTDFHALVDYVKTKSDAGLIDVVTTSEWYNGLSGSLTAPVIGMPTVNSSTSISWNWTDNSGLEESYRVGYVNNGGGTGIDASDLAAGTQSWTATGLSSNTQYSVRIRAYRAEIGESPLSATSSSLYTLANTPAAPVANSATSSSLEINPVSGGAESAMAIYAETGATCDGVGGLGYVQTNGSISGSAVWQTDAVWGTKTVTGLTPHTQYSFCAQARNGDSVETGFSVSANATTLYALSYSAGAHGSLTGSISQSVAPGASGAAVNAVPDAGYRFVNWSDALSANPRTDANVAANIAVTANFAINTHTLAYVAGAHGTIAGTASQTVEYGSSGTAVTAVYEQGYHFVNWSDLSIENPRTDANVTGDLSVTANFAISPHSSATGDPKTTDTPKITVITPTAGTIYKAKTTVGIDWSSSEGSFVKYVVGYSVDNGTTWSTILDNAATTSLSWVVPDIDIMAGKIKVDGYGSSGNLLASSLSAGNFTIIGSVSTRDTTTRSLSPDRTVMGEYSAAEALANTPDIATDRGLVAASADMPRYCTSGTLVKGSSPAVYYCGVDGKRYVFVNERTFRSWYDDYFSVLVVSDANLAQIPIGGNVTYRPGRKMIKVQSDPRVYAVCRGGTLRWVSSEAAAKRIFGENWNKQIDDVSDAFFVNYKPGTSIK